MAPLSQWFKGKSSVYIPREAAFFDSSRASTAFDTAIFNMIPAIRSGGKPESSTPERSGPNKLTKKSPAFPRYNLWPRPKTQTSKLHEDDISVAPQQDRSPSSLSDTSALPKIGPAAPGASNLARRRKMSVPELRKKPPMDSFDTPLLDSPTIPGRPPLRSISSISSDLGQHGRSSSLPEGDLSKATARDRILSPVAYRPPRPRTTSPPLAWPLMARPVEWTTYNPTRPLSPIFSPAGSSTPTSLYHAESALEVGPEVPPKPPAYMTTPPPRKDSLRRTPTSSPDSVFLKHVAEEMVDRPSLYHPHLMASPLFDRAMQEASIMERGRPVSRKETVPPAATTTPETSPKEDTDDYATLPTGLQPMQAALILPDSEKQKIRKQATLQAERFEILGYQEVAGLSKELRTLDERCEYLRKTYKTLRTGRQKLHLRMISYLKNDTITFSKERLLKQEQAVVELDKALDEWAVKLELAENRRLRVRQKLLEHVAAAMMLNPSSNNGLQPTPPGSSSGSGGPSSPEPLRIDHQKENRESIRIYAEPQVLSLFNDIELAMSRMCEAC